MTLICIPFHFVGKVTRWNAFKIYKLYYYFVCRFRHTHIYTFRIVADRSSWAWVWVTGCKERDPLPVWNHTHLDMNFLFAPRPFTNSIKTSFWKSICKCSTLCASVVCARSFALFALFFPLRLFYARALLFLFRAKWLCAFMLSTVQMEPKASSERQLMHT